MGLYRKADPVKRAAVVRTLAPTHTAAAAAQVAGAAERPITIVAEAKPTGRPIKKTDDPKQKAKNDKSRARYASRKSEPK